jgi:hypothetical protein
MKIIVERLPLTAVIVAIMALTACSSKPVATAATRSMPYVFKNVVIKGGGFVTGLIPDPTAGTRRRKRGRH